ncbi:MAG: hypothetical protein V3T39_08445 [Gammaproteobacteria bacterium]
MSIAKQTGIDVGIAGTGIGGVTFDLTSNDAIAFLIGALIVVRIMILLVDLYKKLR